jgi:hypothetical protein
MTDTAIVSYASIGRENYPEVLPRLVQAARSAGFAGDFFIKSPDGPDEFDNVPNRRHFQTPAHADIPYGFKSHLIKHALDVGYRKVIWFDSTIFVVKDFQKIIYQLIEHGTLLFENPGCPESFWTADDCLQQLGCSASDAATFSQVMACAMGFDFSNPLAKKIFDLWYAYGEDGISFKGASGSSRPEFKGHRHDQSVISFLAWKHKLHVIPYGFLSYWDDRQKFDSIVCNRGIGQP